MRRAAAGDQEAVGEGLGGGLRPSIPFPFPSRSASGGGVEGGGDQWAKALTASSAAKTAVKRMFICPPRMRPGVGGPLASVRGGPAAGPGFLVEGAHCALRSEPSRDQIW